MNYYGMNGEVISEDEYIKRSKADPRWRTLRYEPVDGYEVSTVLLSIDHRFASEGPPIIFETMVFPDCEPCRRYSTKEQALAGHDEIIAELRAKAAEENARQNEGLSR